MRGASISEWLAAQGLSQYAELFEQHRIGLDVLCDLTERDFQDLGIPLGDRKRLLKAIQFPTPPQAVASVVTAPPSSHAQAAERRQLTVMFCDLVGSTALSEQLDPEELRELMSAYQQACAAVVEKYEGHVAQYLGDGLMVYFGWPRAHEDDAVRAIRAGLEVAQAVSRLTAMRPISARVGIHTGLVVVGETGEGDASIPKAAVGDTPNIAARLQGLAEAGSVVVSERTRRLAGGLFDYADLGAQTLKGVSEPMHLFRVGEARTIESRFEATRTEMTLTPLVGREEEIALLLRRWLESKEADGQVVLIGGEPGVGKSRLARALRERLGQERYLAMRYQCSPYHLNSALHPTIEQVEHAAGFGRDDSVEQKLDKMHAILRGSEAQITECAPLFASLLSLPTHRYPPLNLSPQKQKDRTLEALATQAEALAEQQPLLMIYEDVHWIDATSQELLDLLVPRLQRLPVLLIVTYRPEYTPHWSEQAHVTILGLNRLGRRQGAELVSNLTGARALPQEVLDQILAHADGVPLFVEELTKSVLESGLLSELGDRYLLHSPLTALSIPATLRDSLIARLDRLAPIREIAQIGACIGREFSYQLLSRVSPLKGERLNEALAQLTRAGMMFRRGTPPDATYTFKHALVQDAAYDSLLKSKRAQLHSEIAEALQRDFPERVASEPELLARHYTAAAVNDRAAVYWLAAAQQAHLRFANTEAIGHARSGLDALRALPESEGRDQQELLLQTTLALALSNAKGYGFPEVWPPYARAQELCNRAGDMPQMFPILGGIFFYHTMRADYEASLQTTTQMLELAHRLNNAGATVLGRWGVSTGWLFVGDFTQAINHSEAGWATYNMLEVRSLAATFNIDPGPCCADWSAWLYWLQGYPEQAERRSHEAVASAKRTAHPFTIVTVLVHAAVYQYFRGYPTLALEHARAANAVCDEVGFPLRKAEADICEGWALTELGESQIGMVKLQSGIETWSQLGTEVGNPFWFAMLALAYQRTGRIQDAKAEITRALETVKRNNEHLWEAELHRLDGLLRREIGEPTEHVEACFGKAIEVARSQGARSLELRAGMSLAQSLHARSRRSEARQLLAPIYCSFTEGLNTTDLNDAKALLEELSSP